MTPLLGLPINVRLCQSDATDANKLLQILHHYFESASDIFIFSILDALAGLPDYLHHALQGREKSCMKVPLLAAHSFSVLFEATVRPLAGWLDRRSMLMVPN